MSRYVDLEQLAEFNPDPDTVSSIHDGYDDQSGTNATLPIYSTTVSDQERQLSERHVFHDDHGRVRPNDSAFGLPRGPLSARSTHGKLSADSRRATHFQ